MESGREPRFDALMKEGSEDLVRWSELCGHLLYFWSGEMEGDGHTEENRYRRTASLSNRFKFFTLLTRAAQRK